jgi:hypothetical protein
MSRAWIDALPIDAVRADARLSLARGDGLLAEASSARSEGWLQCIDDASAEGRDRDERDRAQIGLEYQRGDIARFVAVA